MERVDDLECKGLKIVQNDELYSFTIDSVLLVNLSKVKQKSVVVDLCSGSGIVPILVAGKSRADKVYGIELQERLCDLANKSIALNNLQEKITFINDDIKNYLFHFNKNSIDVVYCNPPYAKCDSFIVSENKSRAMARQEITIKLSDVINVASNLLKFGGVFYMVHQAKRLQEILVELNKSNLAVKELTFCQSKIDKNPHLVVLKAVKGGKMEMIINRTLILNNDDGTLTSDVMELYSKTSI